MSVLLFGFILLYCFVIFRRLVAWQKMPVVLVPESYWSQTHISIIIAVRNEAQNLTALLEDLANQYYPMNLVEVIVVDDHSEDGTAALVNQLALDFPCTLHCISISDKDVFGKKAAVRTGINYAKNELLVFTDGDCRVMPKWLKNIEYLYREKNANFISGPVSFEPVTGLFQKMQAVEFAGLIGIGASSIYLGNPNMCNGANMAYPKKVFNEVGGFTGNEHIASGDDEFLMHKVQAYSTGSVHFLKSREAIVFTKPNLQISSFFKQRVRWAGKWPAYTNWQVRVLAILVFGVNLALFVTGMLALFDLFPWPVFLVALALKFLTDLLFIKPVLQFFDKSRYLPYLLPLQLINTPYVVLTALLALGGSYTWKGRKIKT